MERGILNDVIVCKSYKIKGGHKLYIHIYIYIYNRCQKLKTTRYLTTFIKIYIYMLSKRQELQKIVLNMVNIELTKQLRLYLLQHDVKVCFTPCGSVR